MDPATEEAMLLYLLSKRLKNKKQSSSGNTIGDMLLKELTRKPGSMSSVGVQLLKDSKNKQKKKPDKPKKRIWMHRTEPLREEDGLFTNFYQELRSDDLKFFNYLQMSIATFDELFGCIKDHIKKKNTQMRVSISAHERLVITLRYLASGCSLVELQSTFGVGVSTASKIVREVTACIWSVLAEQEIPSLNRDLFLEISQGFQETTNFPHCIGVIDGKHIKMAQTDNSGFSSVVLLAMCDSDYKFTYIEVGPHGDSSDPRIFKNSALHDKLLKRTLDIPHPSQLGDDEELCPYVILGDEGFPMFENLLKPYGGKDPSEVKKKFNSRLSRARQCIASAFEIMINKWQIFQSPLSVRHDLTENIVKAACVLHNFVLRRDGPPNEIGGEPPRQTALSHIEYDSRSRANPKALNVRDRFAEFFVKNPIERQNKINLTYVNVK